MAKKKPPVKKPAPKRKRASSRPGWSGDLIREERRPGSAADLIAQDREERDEVLMGRLQHPVEPDARQGGIDKQLKRLNLILAERDERLSELQQQAVDLVIHQERLLKRMADVEAQVGRLTGAALVDNQVAPLRPLYQRLTVVEGHLITMGQALATLTVTDREHDEHFAEMKKFDQYIYDAVKRHEEQMHPPISMDEAITDPKASHGAFASMVEAIAAEAALEEDPAEGVHVDATDDGRTAADLRGPTDDEH